MRFTLTAPWTRLIETGAAVLQVDGLGLHGPVERELLGGSRDRALEPVGKGSLVEFYVLRDQYSL